MRKLISVARWWNVLWVAVYLLAPFPRDSFAQSQILGFPPGMFQNKAAMDAPVSVSYTGPGDIVTYASWWGLRGYSLAYSTGSNPAIDLVDQAGANPITINILSTGALDLASINTWVTAHTVTTIRVAKLYDQVSTRHMTQATLADMPVLSLTAIGSLPGLIFSGAASTGQWFTSAATATAAQPMTISAAYKRTGNTGNFGPVIVQYSNGDGMLLANSANVATLYWGAIASTAATDNTFYAVQGMTNGASSTLYINGTSHSVSPGSNAWSAATIAIGADNTGSRFLNGVVLEVGYATGDQSASNSSVNSNQHTYWGF